MQTRESWDQTTNLQVSGQRTLHPKPQPPTIKVFPFAVFYNCFTYFIFDSFGNKVQMSTVFTILSLTELWVEYLSENMSPVIFNVFTLKEWRNIEESVYWVKYQGVLLTALNASLSTFKNKLWISAKEKSHQTSILKSKNTNLFSDAIKKTLSDEVKYIYNCHLGSTVRRSHRSPH